MKKGLITILILAAISVCSCRKDDVQPAIKSTPAGPKAPPVTTGLHSDTTVTAVDTIRGYMHIQMAASKISFDNILVNFDPDSKPVYLNSEDARTFDGFGAVTLSSLSSDKVPLAINAEPLSSKGLTIPLAVSATKSGTYKLNMLKVQSVPAKFDIWLKDKLRNDSLDFRHNTTYSFDIDTQDKTSYGSDRFSLVIRTKQ